MMGLFQGALPEYANRKQFNAPLFSLYVVLHVLVLLAPFTYSPEGLTTLLILYFITICFGITLGYHRLFAHRSYKTRKPIAYLLALLGCLAFQRGPIWWVACHRLHHAEVDTPEDPHSPRFGFLWSHFLWPFFWHPNLDDSPDIKNRLARDLAGDPWYRFLEKHYTSINVLFLALLFGIGYLWGGTRLAMSLLVWGGFLRLALCLNITWLVNSVAHIFGYRNYETIDTSRNNWWVALLTWGEGWHNNHHADARAARNGHLWYEIDVTYWIIALMGKLGLAYEIVPVREGLKRVENALPQRKESASPRVTA